ncbi:cupin domain-containing protein [Ferrovum sp.]|uniref:cupin domain-containing protein n=1 Tax=Ferrovum sp. TaxID=2609467 RepID=UPI0026252474|nr:cupin domain-containing protein [Ferrovum sp.]
MRDTLLGGLTPSDFLTRHWHKSPLRVQQAIPDFLGLLTPAEIKRLATHPTVQTRLILRQGKRWVLRHGPFRPIDFKTLPDKNWTVLVQELNHWVPEGEALLREFDFLPHARLDDLMVSYAVPGGGVGPHFDSYDVFLLQGFGTRRWGIAETEDLELLPDSDLKLLRRFSPQAQWDLEAGDMLYLPPHCAHDGVALSECFTYSIGFRAPTYQEWVEAFLDFLRDRLQVEGRYADPDLNLSVHPGEIPLALIAQVDRMLRQQVRWTHQQVAECVGRYLSEPKPHLFFEPAEESLTLEAFGLRCLQQGLQLDPRSRLLFSGKVFYFNGDRFELRRKGATQMRCLADTRKLSAGAMDPEFMKVLYDAWQAGWIKFFDSRIERLSHRA